MKVCTNWLFQHVGQCAVQPRCACVYDHLNTGWLEWQTANKQNVFINSVQLECFYDLCRTKIFVPFWNIQSLRQIISLTSGICLPFFSKVDILHLRGFDVTAEVPHLVPSFTVWQDKTAYSEEKGGNPFTLLPWHTYRPPSPFHPPLLFSSLFYYSNFRSAH